MFTITYTKAKSRPEEILDKLAEGEDVVITRRGKESVHVKAVLGPKEPPPLEELAKLRASMRRRPSGEREPEVSDEES